MHGLEREVWGKTDPPEPAGTGHGARMLAATVAFETMVDGADRDRPSRWPSSRATGSGPSTTGCSGWWPRSSGWSPTTTSATSGRGPVPGARPRLAVHGDVDERVGGVLALAAGVSWTRRWPA